MIEEWLGSILQKLWNIFIIFSMSLKGHYIFFLVPVKAYKKNQSINTASIEDKFFRSFLQRYFSFNTLMCASNPFVVVTLLGKKMKHDTQRLLSASQNFIFFLVQQA